MELSTEPVELPVELSAGMLGIIGAYGMHAAVDVRDLYLTAAPGSRPPERGLVSADTSDGVRPRATG